jgi:hypothetical protein
MGLTELLSLLAGIVKFLPQVRALVVLLQQSPAERATQISELIMNESEKLRLTGRPTWEK